MSRIEWVEGLNDVKISVPPDMVAEFKLMVQRACHTWQDKSPDMTDFADRLAGIGHLTAPSVVGFSKRIANNMLSSRVRDCCGTSLMEPHHTQCAELSKIHDSLGIKAVVNTGIPEGSAVVVQDGKAVALIKNIG